MPCPQLGLSSSAPSSPGRLVLDPLHWGGQDILATPYGHCVAPDGTYRVRPASEAAPRNCTWTTTRCLVSLTLRSAAGGRHRARLAGRLWRTSSRPGGLGGGLGGVLWGGVCVAGAQLAMCAAVQFEGLIQ
jgi:hypothetical protein